MIEESVKLVRDTIAGLDEGRFDMSMWLGTRGGSRIANGRELADQCDTAGCIAGWTLAVLAPDQRVRLCDTGKVAGELLGLDESAADALFIPITADDEPQRLAPNEIPCELSEVTQAQAVKVLDHLLEFNEVDWRVAFAAEPAR